MSSNAPPSDYTGSTSAEDDRSSSKKSGKSKKKGKKAKKEKRARVPKDMVTNERGETGRDHKVIGCVSGKNGELVFLYESRIKTNAFLQENLTQQEKDALDVISALQKESDTKEQEIKRLHEVMVEMTDEFEGQKVGIVQDCDKKMDDINAVLNEKEAAFKVMQQEFSVIKDFRRKRHDLMKELEYQKQELGDTEKRHRDVIMRLERKFFEEKIRLQKEANRKISELAAKAHKEAVLNLKETTKEVYKENIRMADALRYHVQEGEELSKMNTELVEVNRLLVEEKDLHNVIVKEKILQTKNNEKSIRELHSKIQGMEHSLSHVVREFEHEREIIGSMARKELDEVREVTEKLRARLNRKTMEMRHIKRLAQHILDQRTEVEEYFLESMEFVKKQMKKDREQSLKQEHAEYQQRMRAMLQNKGAMPAVRSFKPRAFRSIDLIAPEPDTPAVNAKAKMDIRELSWEDKEKILRLLFARMNGTSLTKAADEADKARSKMEDIRTSGGLSGFNTSSRGGGFVPLDPINPFDVAETPAPAVPDETPIIANAAEPNQDDDDSASLATSYADHAYKSEPSEVPSDITPLPGLPEIVFPDELPTIVEPAFGSQAPSVASVE